MRFSKSRQKNYPKYTIISIKKCFKRAVSRQQSGNARICRQTRKQTTFVLNFMSKPYQRGTSDEYKL